jgi:hypothetical protein
MAPEIVHGAAALVSETGPGVHDAPLNRGAGGRALQDQVLLPLVAPVRA